MSSEGKKTSPLSKGIVIAGIAIPAVVAAPLVIMIVMCTVLVAMIQAQYGTSCSSSSSSSTSWVAWAKKIADDDSHGYSQIRRTGNPDYDCSSLVYYALKNAGLDVGSWPFNTMVEAQVLPKAGFERHEWTRQTTVSDLQAGDIVWSASHTEIYMGDGRFVGAHHDENGGIEGTTAGDQTGDEISVDSYPSGYTAYYRYKGSLNVSGGDGSTSSAQAVSGSTGSTNVVGMTEADAEAWFGGKQGPNDFCGTYAYGQCTWWTCMRAKKLGWKNIGQYWGDGQNWARSGAAAGYKTTTDAPVPGSIISWPAGVQGSSPTYGHVGIVESVDAAKGTITTSEKGAGYKVYSRTMPIKNGGTYVLPNEKLSGTGGSSGGSAAVEQCVSGDDAGSDTSGNKAGAADARKIAKRKIKEYGWDDTEYQCLVTLWDHESGWNYQAENPSSGAYGIPQALPGSKMATAGQDWKTNAATQIKWGLNYIHGRYSTPCAAWAFWQAQPGHWY